MCVLVCLKGVQKLVTRGLLMFMLRCLCYLYRNRLRKRRRRIGQQ